MHITIDIDDDVLLAAQARAAMRGKSLGGVISELARESLSWSPRLPSGRFAILPRRAEVITVEHVRRLDLSAT